MKTDWWYPTAFCRWGKEEDLALARVRGRNRWTMGEEVEAFEEEFADFHGMSHAVMTNSGSSANLIAVSALTMTAQDAHVSGGSASVPAIAWSTTYAPLIQHGYELTLLDVDDTWNANGERPLSDIHVLCSVLGNACSLPPSVDDGGWLLEDNCESLGAFDERGNLTGTRGNLNTFSFFWSHQVGAIEGGMVLTNDPVLARRLRILRAHGWTRDITDGPVDFEREYEFVDFGYNVRPLELHAAIARAQLKKLPEFIAARIDNLSLFRESVGCLVEHPRLVGSPSPFSLSFLVPNRAIRQVLVDALRAAGIDARLPTGGSFRRHPYGAAHATQLTPVADDIHDRGLFLGNAPWPIPDKIEAAVKVMRRVL